MIPSLRPSVRGLRTLQSIQSLTVNVLNAKSGLSRLETFTFEYVSYFTSSDRTSWSRG
jgi:hypothetical protein